jgi:hypothetical protein
LVNNRPFPDGLFSAHYCHNRACNNVWHIHAATPKENTQDSVRDLRLSLGERHYEAQLTEAAVKEAFSLYHAGWSMQTIAKRNRVTRIVIAHALHRRNWKWVQIPSHLLIEQQ